MYLGNTRLQPHTNKLFPPPSTCLNTAHTSGSDGARRPPASPAPPHVAPATPGNRSRFTEPAAATSPHATGFRGGACRMGTRDSTGAARETWGPIGRLCDCSFLLKGIV